MQANLASLFAATVSVAGGRPEDMTGRLYPEEERLIDGSVAKRRREFTAGRLLARQALARLGRPASPILAQGRRPLWPAGTIGSITHAGVRCGVAVALAEDVAGIGLDVEAQDVVTSELQPHVLTEPERDWLAAMPAATRPFWATLIFSAKEAFYKSLAELRVDFVDFHEVRVQPDANGTFDVVVEAAPLGAELGDLVSRSRWLVEQGWIWTAVTLQRQR